MSRDVSVSKKINTDIIRIYCWWIINIILVGTAIFIKYTIVSNLALMLLYVLSWKIFSSQDKRNSIMFCLGLLLLCGYSIILENNISYIIRFTLIMLFIGMAYFIKLPSKAICQALAMISLIYCVALIIGELYLVLFFDNSFLPTLRYEMRSQNLGDIYPKYGSIYAIQLVGTAALPFVFMLSFVCNLFKSKILIKRLLLLLGVIIAGNFGFIVAIAIFLVLVYFPTKLSVRKWFNRLVIILLCLIAISRPAYNFVFDALEEKKDVSNATRIEQASVLIEDMVENLGTTILGKGLGNTVDKVGKFRDYRDNQYFELQSLYFLNQLGIIPFVLFILWNLYFTFKYIPLGRFKLVYLCYVIYAMTNPYIFNTNQIVVIITLVSLSQVKQDIYNINITKSSWKNLVVQG